MYRSVDGGPIYKISGPNLVTDTSFTICDVYVSNGYYKHSYFVEAVDIFENASGYSEGLTVEVQYISCNATEKVAAGSPIDTDAVNAYSLAVNYPNPFNPTTTILFTLPEAGNVSLKIYNAAGQLVRTLADKSYPAGAHQLVWNGRNELGEAAASGLYFYHIHAGQFSQTRKMLLLR